MNDMSSRPVPPSDPISADSALPADHMDLMDALMVKQAIRLDAVFDDACREMERCGRYVDSAESWARIALRAQMNCRTSLEALSRATDRDARRALRENEK